jgi:hypothetical protein
LKVKTVESSLGEMMRRENGESRENGGLEEISLEVEGSMCGSIYSSIIVSVQRM